MKIKLLLLLILVLSFVGCNQKQNNEVKINSKSNEEIETNSSKNNDTALKENIKNLPTKRIDFKLSDLKISDYSFAEGITEKQKREFTKLMKDLFPYGVEWQVKLYNEEISAKDYKWDEKIKKNQNTSSDNLHQVIKKTIKELKNKGFYPNFNAATCQLFADKDEVQGLVVYTPWISDTNKTVNNFEVHIAPDKSIIGAGIKSVE